MKRRLFLTALSIALTASAGCGKSVNVGDTSNQDDSPNGTPTSPPTAGGPNDPSNPLGPTNPGDPNNPNNPNGPTCSTTRWDFTQPPAQSLNKVDLLFVVDTSDSLSAERAGIAQQLPRFLSALPRDADLHAAVMLAHGGASRWSGRLYAPSGIPSVLSLKALGASRMQSNLRTILSAPPADSDEANGEMLLYSLMRGVGTGRLDDSKSLGFFRDDAALSIVFVTDENDACVDPRAMGYTKFPDFVDSGDGWEDTARARYCVNTSLGAITPDSAIAAVRAARPSQALSLGAVVHVDPSGVPAAVNGSEDAIGHGIIEAVGLTPNHALLDITHTADWSAGLTALGSIVTTQLSLKTDFVLSGALTVDAKSVHVQVDGKDVTFTYSPATRTISIPAADAGSANSSVTVSACAK